MKTGLINQRGTRLWAWRTSAISPVQGRPTTTGAALYRHLPARLPLHSHDGSFNLCFDTSKRPLTAGDKGAGRVTGGRWGRPLRYHSGRQPASQASFLMMDDVGKKKDLSSVLDSSCWGLRRCMWSLGDLIYPGLLYSHQRVLVYSL